MSDSVRPHSRQPSRLRRPWDSPGKNTGVGCHFLLQCMKVKSESEVAQSCPTLSDPMDCSLPGSFAHGIFQAGVLEWGAIWYKMCQHSHYRGSIGEKREKGIKNVSEEIMTKNFPNLKKETDTRYRKHRVPDRMNPNDGTPLHIIIKMA